METITSNSYNKKSKMQTQADSLLSEPLLYVTDQYINEDELRNIFKEVDNINVELRHNLNSAVLRFTSIDNAEKAYAIYNNIKTESRYLKLLINDPSKTIGNEPVSAAYILQVKSLPPSTTNIALYQLFRPFGPLFSCRIQLHHQDNKFKGSALVQYFRPEDAENAMKSMNCFQYENRTISVSQYQGKNPTRIRTNNLSGNNSFNLQSTAQTFSPQGSNNNHNHNNNNNNQIPMSPGPEGPIVDPCNLFIKNLDANISSSDLFNHFRRFGRIISARVMRDQDTGNSKGFGFVSYTSPEEADKAKNSMHGKTLGTKQIVVRLHEPKKLREAKLANHFNGSTSPSESRAPSRRNSDFYNINTVNEFGQEDLSGLAPKARREVLMSELQKRFKYIPTIPSEEVNPIVEQLLTSKVSEVLSMLKDASLLQQKITEARNIIKRRGNEEANIPTTSIVNNSSSNNYQQVSQRERFTKAINKICPRNANEILELLLTLSPKERSLCLFNEQHLNKKILEANEALEAANTDIETPSLKSLITTPASNPPSIEPFVSSHSKSNYSTDVPAVVSISNGVQSPEYKEIEEFMETLKNKPINEQKQKLGDRLFPKVKSLGLKSAIASKVTINLLDTDDLRELAHSMNDHEKFRQKVMAAAEKVPSK